MLDPFPSSMCTCILTGGCALDKAGDNFPGTVHVLMLSFAADCCIIQKSINAAGCVLELSSSSAAAFSFINVHLHINWRVCTGHSRG